VVGVSRVGPSPLQRDGDLQAGLSLWHPGRDSILAKSVLSPLKRGALSCSCVASRRLRTTLLLSLLVCGATRAFSHMFRVCAQLPLVARLPHGSLHALQHPNALPLCQTLHIGLNMPLCQTLHIGLNMPDPTYWSEHAFMPDPTYWSEHARPYILV